MADEMALVFQSLVLRSPTAEELADAMLGLADEWDVLVPPFENPNVGWQVVLFRRCGQEAVPYGAGGAPSR